MRGGLVRPHAVPARAIPPVAASPETLGRVRTGSESKPFPADLLIWMIGGSLLAYIWRIQDIFPVFAALKYPLLLTVGTLGIYVLNEDRRRKIETIRHPIVTMVAVFTLLMAASIPTSLLRGYSLNLFLQDHLRSLLLMAILIASVRCFKDIERYALWFLVGGVIFNQFVQRKAELGAEGRLVGVAYYDANDLGMMIVMSIPILLYFLVRGRPSVRILTLAALVLYILVFLKSGSRGGFLGLVIVGGYLIFQFHAVSKSARIGTVAIVAILMTTFAGDQYWNTIQTILKPEEDYNMQSDDGRMEIWKRGLGYMTDRPITGVGYQAFPVAEGTLSQQAQRQMYGVGFKWSAAHNSFIQVGAEIGVPGLIVFVTLLWKTFFTARRIGSRRDPDGKVPDEAVMGQALAGSIVGFVVCGFFLSQAYACTLLFFFAMVVALEKVCNMGDSASRVGMAEMNPRMRTFPATARLPNSVAISAGGD